MPKRIKPRGEHIKGFFFYINSQFASNENRTQGFEGLAKSAARPFAGSGTNKLSFIIFAFLALEGQNFTENNKQSD